MSGTIEKEGWTCDTERFDEGIVCYPSRLNFITAWMNNTVIQLTKNQKNEQVVHIPDSKFPLCKLSAKSHTYVCPID